LNEKIPELLVTSPDKLPKKLPPELVDKIAWLQKAPKRLSSLRVQLFHHEPSVKIYMEIKTKERLPRILRWLNGEEGRLRERIDKCPVGTFIQDFWEPWLKQTRLTTEKLTPFKKINQETKISRLIHAYACALFEGELAMGVGGRWKKDDI